jgi:hypothetical protein
LPPVDAERLDWEFAQLRSALMPEALDALEQQGADLYPAKIVAMALEA